MSGIFFLGAGKMATAICGGLVKSGLYEAGDLAAFDVSEAAGKAFSQATGVRIRPLDAVEEAEALLRKINAIPGDFRIGDRVISEQIVPCGKCRYCKAGKYWLCERVPLTVQ